MKIIKKYRLLIIAIFWLGGCWLIGQQLHPENRQNNSSVLQNVDTEINTENANGLNNNEWNDISFVGNENTDDNPWGITAGTFDMENEGECVLLTPNTSVILNDLDGVSEISFDYQIHPWMKEHSDGAGLLIWLMDAEDNILFEQNISVSNEQNWNNCRLELLDFPTVQKVEIFCNNGLNNDDSGDWVVIKPDIMDVDLMKTVSFDSDGYVKSATYFADEWPVNFWNSEMDYIDEDMIQIKSDGFNSIIIVIPWREFQPTNNPISYNEYAFMNLDKVMRAAENNGLKVYTRIGYTWDFYNDENSNIVDQYCELLGNPLIKKAWYDYVDKMYMTLSTYDNFAGGFLTWEDFWNTLGICDVESIDLRLEKAKFIGYQDWIKDNYTLEKYNKQFGTSYKAYEDVPVPQKNEPAMWAMYEYYDNFLNTILKNSQQYFPNLSMEVRMDWDVVYNTNGNVEYYKHNNTYACENSNFTSTMYGIPMGFENNGEIVSYSDAMEKTEYILQQLKQQNDGKAIYVEQFIFADNTPAFKNNAQIKDDEIDDYLENVADILLDNTEGYGIWTYRNYCANMIYNSQFALDGFGWNTTGDVQFTYLNSSRVCDLNENSSIQQLVPDIRNHFDSQSYVLEIDVVNVEKSGTLAVSIGDETQEVKINSIEKISLTYNRNESFDLKIYAKDCDVDIDNINLYTQIQEGFIYDENNMELDCTNAIRNLNKQL